MLRKLADALALGGALSAVGAVHAADSAYGTCRPVALPVALAAGQPANAGYLTTVLGSGGIFYSASAAPSVIAYDNAHPDTVTTTDIATALTVLEVVPLLNIADHTTAPVLLGSGQQDKFFCSAIGVVSCTDLIAVRAYETPYFASAKSLPVDMVADTGHDLPLHPSANVSFSLIDQWIHTH